MANVATDEQRHIAFGVKLLADLYAELGEAGARSLEQKIRAIGLEPASLRDRPRVGGAARERAIRGLRLLKGNLLGPGGPLDASPENVALLFDAMRRTADGSAMPPGTTLQWEFTDHDPWHIVLETGARAQRGRAAAPDLTLRSSLPDWVDVAAGRADPLKLALRRRLRVSGSLRLLPRLPKRLRVGPS
jgi:hypothetical protein